MTIEMSLFFEEKSVLFAEAKANTPPPPPKIYKKAEYENCFLFH